MNFMIKSDKTIENLIELLNDSNPETDEELMSFLDTKEGGEAFDFLADVNEATNRKFQSRPDVDKEWEKLVALHEADEETRSKSPRAERHWRVIFSRVAISAAAILLIAFIFSNLYQKDADSAQVSVQNTVTDKMTGKIIPAQTIAKTISHGKESSVTYKTINVPSRSTYTVTLCDGTEVCLNAKSTLIYPTSFTGNRREVTLKGEGYFKVKHDAAHPFIINTEKMSTKVLGTEFNICCYDAENTHVTLVSGMVEVSSESHTVRIRPNEDAKLIGSELKVKHVNVAEFIGWRDGIIHFDNATLRVILQQLCHWYDASVVCKDKELLDKHFHYTFNNRGSIEEALKLLNASSEVNATYEDGIISIQP